MCMKQEENFFECAWEYFSTMLIDYKVQVGVGSI